jgi:hypothetical protein
MAAPKKPEPLVRVTLTLRKEDFDYLTRLAVIVFGSEDRVHAHARLRRGERPGASMSVRYLIDRDKLERFEARGRPETRFASTLSLYWLNTGEIPPGYEELKRLEETQPVAGEQGFVWKISFLSSAHAAPPGALKGLEGAPDEVRYLVSWKNLRTGEVRTGRVSPGETPRLSEATGGPPAPQGALPVFDLDHVRELARQADLTERAPAPSPRAHARPKKKHR